MSETYPVTNTFTADTTAVASEVNQNFTDVLSALNDFNAGNVKKSGTTLPLAVIANLTTTQFATNVVDTDDTLAANSDTRIPSQQAIKAYIDNRVGLTYHYLPVDGSSTQVYTKYLTGTLDNDAETSVAHGITGIGNILLVAVSVLNDSGEYYANEMFRTAAAATAGITVKYDGTNIILSDIGTQWQGNNYRIKIDYK
jgi:hypothetical protein